MSSKPIKIIYFKTNGVGKYFKNRKKSLKLCNYFNRGCVYIHKSIHTHISERRCLKIWTSNIIFSPLSFSFNLYEMQLLKLVLQNAILNSESSVNLFWIYEFLKYSFLVKIK